MAATASSASSASGGASASTSPATRAEERDVAVAVFETEGVEETVLRASRREAQAMGQLGEHPHVVTVYDAGEEEGRPYVASRYMPGGDVETPARRLADGAPARRSRRALGDRDRRLRALEHAHARGIVHRDLKPANVWLDGGRHGQARRLRARRHRPAARARRSRGCSSGPSPTCRPSRRWAGAPDARSDLYSLGALLYEMLTGQPPFAGDDAVAIISQHLNAEPVPPSRHVPELPRGARRPRPATCSRRRPQDRPDSAAAARRELEAIAARPADAPEQDTERARRTRSTGWPAACSSGASASSRTCATGSRRRSGGAAGCCCWSASPGSARRAPPRSWRRTRASAARKVHWGRCHEGEGAPAYWPWAQAIRSYVREADPVALAWELGQGGGRGRPARARGRDRLGDVPEPPALDPDEARFRLFDSVATLPRAARRGRGRWSSSSTTCTGPTSPRCCCSSSSPASSRDSGLLVVGTYRDVELGRHHPLARTLAELARDPGTPPGHAARSRHGGDRALHRDDGRASSRRAGLAEAVHEQTEGNPFFVGEVVRLLASEGSLEGPAAGGWELAIPQGVREVVGRRLDRLPDEANQVLTLAAAVGREFDLERARGPERQAADELVAGARRGGRGAGGRGGAAGAGALLLLPRARPRDPLRGAHRGRDGSSSTAGSASALERALRSDDPDRPCRRARPPLHRGRAGGRRRQGDRVRRARRRAAPRRSSRTRRPPSTTSARSRSSTSRALRTPRGALALLLELGEAQRRAGRFVAARETLEEAAGTSRASSATRNRLRGPRSGSAPCRRSGRLDEADRRR